jgi:hypothetical protein
VDDEIVERFTLWQLVKWYWRPARRTVRPEERRLREALADRDRTVETQRATILDLRDQITRLESLGRIKDAELEATAAVIKRNHERVKMETALAVRGIVSAQDMLHVQE